MKKAGEKIQGQSFDEMLARLEVKETAKNWVSKVRKLVNSNTSIEEQAAFFFENILNTELNEHGMAHMTRTAFLAPVILNLLRLCGHPAAMTFKGKILSLQIASLWHDAARKNDTLDIWELQSAEWLFYYLTQVLEYDTPLACSMAEAIANKDWDSITDIKTDSKIDKPYYQLAVQTDRSLIWNLTNRVKEKPLANIIIHECDWLEFLRTNQTFSIAYSDIYQRYAKDPFIFFVLSRLMLEYKSILERQGDYAFRKRPEEMAKLNCKNAFTLVQSYLFKNTVEDKFQPINIPDCYTILPLLYANNRILTDEAIKKTKSLLLDFYQKKISFQPKPKMYLTEEGKEICEAFERGELIYRGITMASTIEVNISEQKSAARGEFDRIYGSPEGNLNRSAVLLMSGLNTEIFDSQGIATVLNLKKLQAVYEKDADTAMFEKSGLSLPKSEMEEKIELIKKLQLHQLQGGCIEFKQEKFSLHHEIVYNFSLCKAIIWSTSPAYRNQVLSESKSAYPFHRFSPLLQALFLQREHEIAKRGKIILMEYSIHGYLVENQFEQKDILSIWNTICSDYLNEKVSQEKFDVLFYDPNQIKILSVNGDFLTKQTRQQLIPADSNYEEKLQLIINQGIKTVQNKCIEFQLGIITQKLSKGVSISLKEIIFLLHAKPDLIKKENELFNIIIKNEIRSLDFDQINIYSIDKKNLPIASKDEGRNYLLSSSTQKTSAYSLFALLFLNDLFSESNLELFENTVINSLKATSEWGKSIQIATLAILQFFNFKDLNTYLSSYLNDIQSQLAYNQYAKYFEYIKALLQQTRSDSLIQELNQILSKYENNIKEHTLRSVLHYYKIFPIKKQIVFDKLNDMDFISFKDLDEGTLKLLFVTLKLGESLHNFTVFMQKVLADQAIGSKGYDSFEKLLSLIQSVNHNLWTDQHEAIYKETFRRGTEIYFPHRVSKNKKEYNEKHFVRILPPGEEVFLGEGLDLSENKTITADMLLRTTEIKIINSELQKISNKEKKIAIFEGPLPLKELTKPIQAVVDAIFNSEIKNIFSFNPITRDLIASWEEKDEEGNRQWRSVNITHELENRPDFSQIVISDKEQYVSLMGREEVINELKKAIPNTTIRSGEIKIDDRIYQQTDEVLHLAERIALYLYTTKFHVLVNSFLRGYGKCGSACWNIFPADLQTSAKILLLSVVHCSVGARNNQYRLPKFIYINRSSPDWQEQIKFEKTSTPIIYITAPHEEKLGIELLEFYYQRPGETERQSGTVSEKELSELYGSDEKNGEHSFKKRYVPYLRELLNGKSELLTDKEIGPRLCTLLRGLIEISEPQSELIIRGEIIPSDSEAIIKNDRVFKLISGRPYSAEGFLSATHFKKLRLSTPKAAYDFLNSYQLFIIFLGINSHSISSYSQFPDEHELLLNPNTQFDMLNFFLIASKRFLILQEVRSLDDHPALGSHNFFPLNINYDRVTKFANSPSAIRILSAETLITHHIDGDNNCLFNAFALGLVGLVIQGSLSEAAVLKKLQEVKITEAEWKRCLVDMQHYLKKKDFAASLNLQRILAPFLRQIAAENITKEKLAFHQSICNELSNHILINTDTDLLRDDDSVFAVVFEKIKNDLLSKKSDSKSDNENFEKEVYETIHQWFSSGMGYLLYQDNMAKNRVWGGGPEALILGKFFGISMAICHGNNPIRADISGQCDFGQAPIYFNEAPDAKRLTLTEEEYKALRSAELIIPEVFEGKDFIPAVIKFAYVTDTYLNKSLEELSKNLPQLKQKFLEARAKYYRAPEQIMAIHNPYGHHWSTLASMDGCFNVQNSSSIRVTQYLNIS